MAPSKGLSLTDEPSLRYLATPEAVVVTSLGNRSLGQEMGSGEEGSAAIRDAKETKQ